MPTPVIESRPAANQVCTKCSEKKCCGHYKSTIPTPNSKAAPVPSVLLASEVEADPNFDTDRIHRLARQCILPPKTVQFYVNHLIQVQKNRIRGAEKAAKTRLAKKMAASS